MRTTVVLVLGMLLGGAAVSVAQQPADSAARAAEVKERMAKLQERLKLTPQQTEQLKPILQKEAEEMRGIRNKYGAQTSQRDKRKMAGEMKGVMEKHEPEVDAVLTPEQKAEWKKFKEERKQEMKEKHAKKKGM